MSRRQSLPFSVLFLLQSVVLLSGASAQQVPEVKEQYLAEQIFNMAMKQTRKTQQKVQEANEQGYFFEISQYWTAWGDRPKRLPPKPPVPKLWKRPQWWTVGAR
ncbi:MAG: hypothetical protein ACO4AU_03900 [bacterium]